MANAIALNGAIIESVEGSTMRYYKRCAFCGETPNSTTTSSVPSVGNVLHSSFTCNKCRRTNEIKIKGI
jgi:C4-type Zn-finger protein